MWMRRSGDSVPGPGLRSACWGGWGWDIYGSAFPISDRTYVSGRLRAGRLHCSRGKASQMRFGRRVRKPACGRTVRGARRPGVGGITRSRVSPRCPRRVVGRGASDAPSSTDRNRAADVGLLCTDVGLLCTLLSDVGRGGGMSSTDVLTAGCTGSVCQARGWHRADCGPSPIQSDMLGLVVCKTHS